MARQSVGLSSSPNDYIGIDRSVIPIQLVSRRPTTSDKKYRIGQVWILGRNPTTGSQGELWYLSNFESNGDATWRRFIQNGNLATTTEPGIIEIATDAEAAAASSGSLALVPSNLTSIFESPPNLGNVTPATVEGTTGTFGLLNVDNVRIDGNTINVTDTNGDLNIHANGTGNILFDGYDVICGNPGGEASGININGVTYNSNLKSSEIGASNLAQYIMHRHSTTAWPLIVGARSNSDDSSHVAVTSGQRLFTTFGTGWTGSHYDFFGALDISADTSGTISATSSPGRIRLMVTPDGSNTLNTALTISNNSDVTLANALGETSGGTGQSTYTTGDILYADGANSLAKLPVGSNGEVLTLTAGIPAWSSSPGTQTNYYQSANPLYATAATYTVASFFVRNSADDGNISKNTSTTIDISTTGLNGVAISAALAGTISASGTAVTGSGTAFDTDFQVGDVIYSTTDSSGRRITNIADATNLTVESSWTITGGASYRRGGEAPTTHYYTYAITDGNTPGLILSTRNVAGGDTLIDLPSGYDKSRQMVYSFRNDSSEDLTKGVWADDLFIHQSQFLDILSGGNATSLAQIDTSTLVPATSLMGYFVFEIGNTSGTSRQMYVTTDLTGVERLIVNTAASSGQYQVETFMPLDSSQSFHYRLSSASGTTANIKMVGYKVTEVNS